MDEIDVVLVKINSRPTKNLVNIMLTGLSDRKEKKQNGLTAHQPGLEMSDLMFFVALSNTWSLGLDWMLSIDRNITIGPQYRTSVCSFTIEGSLDVIFTDLRKPFLVFAGKSLQNIQYTYFCIHYIIISSFMY